MKHFYKASYFTHCGDYSHRTKRSCVIKAENKDEAGEIFWKNQSGELQIVGVNFRKIKTRYTRNRKKLIEKVQKIVKEIHSEFNPDIYLKSPDKLLHEDILVHPLDAILNMEGDILANNNELFITGEETDYAIYQFNNDDEPVLIGYYLGS